MRKKDNAFKKMLDKLQIEQIQKFLRVVIICMLFMVIAEGLFEIPVIRDFFGASLIEGKSGWLVYVIVWIVMFAQVTIIPIPALPILTACNQMAGLVAKDNSLSGLFSLNTLSFLLLTSSAAVLGSICAYWLGRKFGKPAIKWVAGSEEDYNKWSDKFNSKTGKWVWAATVLFPLFPDDLISFVVGAIKMNFGFYAIVNIICKITGTFTMWLFMRLPGIDIFFGTVDTVIPWALIVYTLLLLIALITKFILNRKVDLSQPKNIKLEVVREQLIAKLTKKKNTFKELLIDYNLRQKFRTYLASEVEILTLYETDKNDSKYKINILILCKASNYWQIIFNKKYPLTTKYQEFLNDVKKLEEHVSKDNKDTVEQKVKEDTV